MKRRVLVAALLAAMLGGLVGCSGPEQPPQTFGPWYPIANSDGDPAVADFENHVPCALDESPAAECQRIKLGVVLYRDAETDDPTTFLISIVRVGVSDDRETLEGDWSLARGTGLDPDATIYELDGVPEQLRRFWPIGDDILFLLDDEGMPRVGDAAYGFALNSIPLGQTVRVPD